MNPFAIITDNHQMSLFYKGMEIKYLKQLDFTNFTNPELTDINFTVAGHLVDINLDLPNIEKHNKTTEELLVEEILKRDEVISILKQEIIMLKRQSYVQAS